MRLFFIFCLLLILGNCALQKAPTEKKIDPASSYEAFKQDRPAVANHLQSYPDLDLWLMQKFAEPLGKYRRSWNNAQPNNALASHSYYPMHNFLIIKVSQKQAPADQLACLVYEINNSRRYDEVVKLILRAEKGTILRDDYVDRILDIEISAFQNTRDVLLDKMYIPLSRRSKLISYKSLIDGPKNINELTPWQLRYFGKTKDMRARYGKQYDRHRYGRAEWKEKMQTEAIKNYFIKLGKKIRIL